MRRTRVLKTVLGLCVVVLLSGIYLFVHYINSPAAASNITNPALSNSRTTTHTPRAINVVGPYASFSYPASFTASPQSPLMGNVLAIYSYEHRALIPWQLTITITMVPNGSPDSDSAYYARIENPAQYTESTETINNKAVTIMTDSISGGFNKVAFLFHDDRSADIAFSSQDAQNSAEEQTVLNQVLRSWRWI
jgi:hypothetical protein